MRSNDDYVENLFAQKLRRTVSQPNMTLKGAPKSKASANKEKPLGVLSTTSISSAHIDKARNLFGRPQAAAISTSSGKGVPSDKNASLKQAPLLHGSPGRRGQKRPRLTAGGLRALEEVTEHDTDMLEEHEDLQTTLSVKKLRNDRDGSPTPSIATNRSFASTTNGQMKPPARKGAGSTSLMKRSMSMPPGRLDFGAAAGNVGSKAASLARTREASLAPTELTVNAGDESGSSSMETRNKGVSQLLASSSKLRSYWY